MGGINEARKGMEGVAAAVGRELILGAAVLLGEALTAVKPGHDLTDTEARVLTERLRILEGLCSGMKAEAPLQYAQLLESGERAEAIMRALKTAKRELATPPEGGN